MESSAEQGSEPREMITGIYSEFMLRITKFEELVSEGSKFLTAFREALGIIGRSPIDTSSSLIENILDSCGTRQVLSYIASGSVKADDGAQSVSKCKILVGELESFVNEATSLMDAMIANCEDAHSFLDSSSNTNEEPSSSGDLLKQEVTHYASILATVYNMVKLDYTMQARIVCSLGFKSSQGELETYCEMWSLRPYVDDETMQKAWSLLPP